MGPWQLKREGPVAVLTMDDGKANTLLLAEFDGLSSALKDVAASDASALVLHGRPGYFSAGLNLKVMPTLAPAEMQALIQRFGEVVIELLIFPKPVVAAVSGHALGAGAIFGLASDVRLFAEGPFKFGFTEVPGGLFVPSFGIVAARASAQAHHLTSLVLHGRILDPAQALDLEIAESLHPQEALLPAAIARATALGDLSGEAYGYTKQLLRGGLAEEARRNLPETVGRLGTLLTGKR